MVHKFSVKIQNLKNGILTEGGNKRSSTMRNKNGTLYIYENKKGQRIMFDGLNSFARRIGVDAGNLYRTFKNRTYWAKGWKLTDVIDLCEPNWALINKKVRSCKVIDRIMEKLDNIEKNLLSIRKFGRAAWSAATKYVREYVQEKSKEKDIKPNYEKSMRERENSIVNEYNEGDSLSDSFGSSEFTLV